MAAVLTLVMLCSQTVKTTGRRRHNTDHVLSLCEYIKSVDTFLFIFILHPPSNLQHVNWLGSLLHCSLFLFSFGLVFFFGSCLIRTCSLSHRQKSNKSTTSHSPYRTIRTFSNFDYRLALGTKILLIPSKQFNMVYES